MFSMENNRWFCFFKRKNRKWINLGLMIAMLTLLLPSVPAQAADSDTETVRVGWYHSDMFQEGSSDEEPKGGYCYDYLQKVADYAPWRYEYVYGSWADLYEMLEHGEIDFLGGVSITEERQGKMLFPDSEMGVEEYYLCKKAEDNTISASDKTTLNGKKVGLIYHNLMSDYTERWIRNTGLDITTVYYKSFEDRDAALEKGEIDLKTTTLDNALVTDQIREVAKVGEEAYYVAVSASREDLLEELNEALTTMVSLDPYILQNLKYKNYGSVLSGKELTEGETQWLEEHDVVMVGYMDNYLPYSDEDEQGEVRGLITDALVNAFSA